MMRIIRFLITLMILPSLALGATTPLLFEGKVTFEGRITVEPAVAPEPEGPTISNIVATVTSPTTVTISWDLSEAGTGETEYGTTTAYGSSGGVEARLFTSHSQALEGFTPDTLYHFRVRSANAAGYVSVSADGTFTTDALPAPPGTADFYVSTTGNDTTGDGSSGNPWRTIQKAADTVTSGGAEKVISVAPGTYAEPNLLINTNSGSAGNLIRFVAEDGVVLDGGNVINPAHWAQSTAVGACGLSDGVYEVTYAQLGFTPDNGAVNWNGKTIGWYADAIHATNGLGFLCTASGSNAWLGVVAIAARKSSRLLVRYHDKTHPATATVKVCATDRGAITFDNVSYVTFENFTVTGCSRAVFAEGSDVHHVRVTGGTLQGGRDVVWIAEGANNIEIDNNFITLNYIYPDVGHSRYRSTADENLFQLMRVKGDLWGNGVQWFNAGDANNFHDNTVSRVMAGAYPHIADPVVLTKNSNLKINDNRFEYCLDFCFVPHQTPATNMEFLGNEVHEYHHGIRFGPLYSGPVYIGFNKFSMDTTCAQLSNCSTPGDLFMSQFGTTPPQIYVYHNSLSGNVADFAINGESFDNYYFLNNIFSAAKFFQSPSPSPGPDYFDYNWVGGQFGSQQSWTTGTHNIFSTNNRLWTDPPTFAVTGTAAENAGLRCDQANWLSGQSALPRCTADAAPNMGAVQ